MNRAIPYILVFLSLTGCSDFYEYSPNQVHDNDSPRNLNAHNLTKLLDSQLDDTISVLFMGDSQQFYDEVDLFVNRANELDGVDFVLIAGDISDFGLLQEFEWIEGRLNKLKMPYFGVIGNHDVVGNGERVFEKMFGPLNFSFVYDSVKFILHNTNSREYRAANVPDLNWLSNELSPETGVANVVAVSHVPPFSADFNPALVQQYAALFGQTPGFLLSLHGHIHAHSDGYPYDDGVRYITSYSFQQRSMVMLKIAAGSVTKELIAY